MVSNRIEDLEKVLRVIIGPTELEPPIPPINFDLEEKSLTSILYVDNYKTPVAKEVKECIEKLINKMAEDKMTIKKISEEQLRFSDLRQIFNRAYMTMIGAKIPKTVRNVLCICPSGT